MGNRKVKNLVTRKEEKQNITNVVTREQQNKTESGRKEKAKEKGQPINQKMERSEKKRGNEKQNTYNTRKERRGEEDAQSGGQT
ncbi:hypothetical protein Pmani_019379 [Petrolisthes manimaculis]|uniref:Uncharacterized protein n=1 Tax=Petrolisthes manimaculis TaxID=1843537 RepID=A0AAE1U7R4_9EUCA|nr:hypothetical protein Pmani_019379 [Petrolisthes manimaculis]